MRTNFAALAPIIILLALALGGTLIYFLIYKKRVNKALQEGSDTDSAGPEPANVSRSGLMIVLIIAMGIMLIRISNLNSSIQKLNDLAAAQNNRLMNLENTLNDLRSDLEEKNRLTGDLEVLYGKMDPADHTAEVLFKVTPKKVTDETSIVIAADDVRIPLDRSSQSTAFSGTLKTDIFRAFTEPLKILITEGGETMTEETEYYELTELWQHYLPQIITSGGGSSKWKNGRMSIEWSLGLDLFAKSEYGQFEKSGITLTTRIGKEVTETKDISGEIRWNENYGTFQTEIKQDISMKEEQEFEMTVRARDNMGYTHECTVIYLGAGQAHEEEKTDSERIYDAAGKLISQ